MESKDLIRNLLLGQNPSNRTQTIANIIGGAVIGGGLLGLSGQRPKTFAESTADTQNKFNAIMPTFDKRNEAITKDFNANLAGYETRTVGQATEGLKARGITDAGVARETAANVKSGLSGAYAAARAALTGAKLNASRALGIAGANYQMNLAESQYKSLMANYASKMGIWGALGGLGTGIAALPSNKTIEKPKIDETDIGLLNKEGI